MDDDHQWQIDLLSFLDNVKGKSAEEKQAIERTRAAILTGLHSCQVNQNSQMPIENLLYGLKDLDACNTTGQNV